MEPLFQTVTQYGYIGLFVMLLLGIVGLPFPVETLLVVAGVLVARGKLQIAGAAIAALAGGFAGISISYFIGLTIGATLIQKYGKYIHLKPEHIDRTHEWFRSSGEWVLIFGYFIPGVRHFTALVAGMSSLEYRKFALFAYSGAVLWIGAFLGLGYFLGDNWESTLHLVHHYTRWAILAAALIAGIAYLIRRRIRKSLAAPTPSQTVRD